MNPDNLPAGSPLPPQPERQPVAEPKTSKEDIKSVFATLGILLLAPLLAIFLTVFVFQSYQVDGPSMQTTLHNGDRLIVFKLPRALARLTHHQYLPNRGDVIIFNEPTGTDSAISDSKQLVKRVIGLPGDHVVVKNGSLTIFNRQHPNGYSPDKTLPYGSVIGTTAGDVDLVVPANQIFVCGDNRGNSFDSRYFGTVPLSNVIGKLEVRVYPFNQFKFF